MSRNMHATKQKLEMMAHKTKLKVPEPRCWRLIQRKRRHVRCRSMMADLSVNAPSNCSGFLCRGQPQIKMLPPGRPGYLCFTWFPELLTLTVGFVCLSKSASNKQNARAPHVCMTGKKGCCKTQPICLQTALHTAVACRRQKIPQVHRNSNCSLVAESHKSATTSCQKRRYPRFPEQNYQYLSERVRWLLPRWVLGSDQ